MNCDKDLSCKITSARTTEEVWEALRANCRVDGYELFQVNGQRKFYNVLDKKLHTPSEGSEVFVGRLPRNLFEDELVPVFMRIGKIYEMRLMMNFSGTNRGFAFVMYNNPETARLAVRALNNFEVREGHHIGVLLSVNNRRLYIGGLHAGSDIDEALFSRLQRLTDGVESLSVHPMKKQRGKPKCRYALVVYRTHRDAAMARRLLIPHRDDLFGADVTVDWACPKMEPKARLSCMDDRVTPKCTSLKQMNTNICPSILKRQPILFSAAPGSRSSRTVYLGGKGSIGHAENKSQSFQYLMENRNASTLMHSGVQHQFYNTLSPNCYQTPQQFEWQHAPRIENTTLLDTFGSSSPSTYPMSIWSSYWDCMAHSDIQRVDSLLPASRLMNSSASNNSYNYDDLDFLNFQFKNLTLL